MRSIHATDVFLAQSEHVAKYAKYEKMLRTVIYQNCLDLNQIVGGWVHDYFLYFSFRDPTEFLI